MGKKHKGKQKESIINIVIKAVAATAALIAAIAQLIDALR